MSLSRRLKRQAERQAIKGKIDITKMREDGIYRLTSIHFEQFIKKLNDKQRDFIMSNPLPNKYSHIRQLPFVDSNHLKSIINNLQWYSNSINLYAVEIRAFLGLKKQYEKCLLVGEYDNALTIINNINESICYSQWALEQTLLIHEYKDGLKANKKSLNINTEDVEGVVQYAAYLQSMRVEKNMSLYQYSDLLSKIYENIGETERKYYSYKTSFFELSQFDWSLYLQIENVTSILDRYLLFQTATTIITSTKSLSDSLSEKTSEIVGYLAKLLDDDILYNTALVLEKVKLDKTNIDTLTSLVYKAFDLYIQGMFKESTLYCRNLISEYPHIIELYEIYILSILNTDKNLNNPFPDGSISNRILTRIYWLYKKEDQVDQSLTDILKLCYTLGSNSSISFNLFSIFSKHYLYVEQDIDREKLSTIHSVKGNTHLGYYNKNFRQGLKIIETNPLISDSLKVQFDLSSFQQLHKIPYNSCLKVNPFQKALNEADIIMHEGLTNEAIEYYDSILKNPEFENDINILFNLENIVHRKLVCLINQMNFASAIELVTLANLKNPGFSIRLGYKVLLDRAGEGNLDSINTMIHTPILLSQYAVRYSISINSIWMAYDNFMYAMGIRIPSDLRNLGKWISNDCIVYFLRYVCIQEILGLSYNDFENEDDLDNERMAVLALLSEIDAKHYDIYVEEIQAISSNIEIRKGVKQLDESKIYVDVPGIRMALEKDLKEIFNRSLELDTLNMPDLEKLIERLGMSVSVLSVDEETNKLKVVTKSPNSKESRYKSFSTAFLKIRDMFITNSDFGLDSYISMRIRHGALLGQIRSIFDGFELVTKRRSDTDEYIDNSFWIDRLSLQSSSNIQSVNTSFAIFSSMVDKYSEELKNKWIQLNTEQKPTDGLFNYVYDDYKLEKLYKSKFRFIDTYEMFFELAIDELWNQTEKNLEILRKNVLSETQDKILNALDSLSRELSNQIREQDLTEFLRAVTECKTQFRYEMEKIANWFRRSNNTTINDFRVDLAIKASLTTVRKMHRKYYNFLPLQNIISDTVFNGKFFPHFSDLFRNLFDNILTHSGLNDDKLEVNLSVVDKNGFLEISIENSISDQIPIVELNEKIDQVKSLFNDPYEYERSRGEGGTGYPKINKLLRSGLGRSDYKIEIDPINIDRRFKVTIIFETKGLITK